MERTIYHIAATGGTFHAYPLGESLEDWETHAVELVEGEGADVGRYSGTVDDEAGLFWAIFSGETAPEDWSEAVTQVSVSVYQGDATHRLGELYAMADNSPEAKAAFEAENPTCRFLENSQGEAFARVGGDPDLP